MGDRAIIRSDKGRTKLGVYVHWLGNVNYVTAFVTYCGLKGYRDHDEEEEYASARLAQVVANYNECDSAEYEDSFDLGLGKLGIGVVDDWENWVEGCDNGFYAVSGWKIVDSTYHESAEYAVVRSLIEDIDRAQPEPIRLTDRQREQIEPWLHSIGLCEE